MDTKSILKMICMAIICTLMVVSIVVPIIESGQTVLYEERNNVGYNYTALDDESLTFEHVTGSTNLINGVSRDLATEFGGTVWVISDHVTIRIGTDTRTSFICDAVSGTMVEGDKFVFTDGSVSITTNQFTGTYTYDYLFMPDASGEYGAFFNVPVFVNKSQDVIVFKTGINQDVHYTGIYNYYTGFRFTSNPLWVVAGGENREYAGTLDITSSVELNGASYELRPYDLEERYILENGEEVINYSDRFFIAPVSYYVSTMSESIVMDLISTIPIFVILGVIVALFVSMRRT